MYNPQLHFHFTGIGGTGMSGLAEILLSKGFRVSGSDLRESGACRRLRKQGAEVSIGHSADYVPESASLLVYSSAVPLDNPELVEARDRGLPVIRRAEVLAELMRLEFGVAVAGSHGKTTTTTMIGTVMEAGDLDPTVIIGGIVKAHDAGGRLGRGEYLVAESDESDKSFLLLKPTVAVVTNIDHEHVEIYGSFDDLVGSFKQFLDGVPFYGLSVLCIDDPVVRELRSEVAGRVVTYGVSDDAEIQARNIQHAPGQVAFDVFRYDEFLASIVLPCPGVHLALNSLAAIAVGLEFGVELEVIQSSLAAFGGVGRRIEVVGELNGVTVIDDYGHHPTEVKATLRAIRNSWEGTARKIHVVFQPHRYSRTRDCLEEFRSAFNDGDTLTMTEIYSAGEEPIVGISGESLCASVDHSSKDFIPGFSEISDHLNQISEEGDLIVFLGAGSISQLAREYAAGSAAGATAVGT